MAITINGSANTVAGLAVGGLPDGTVDADTLASNAVTNVKVADDAIGVAELSTTGTAGSTTFLRGDNAWQAAGGGKLLQVVGSSLNTNTAITSSTKSTTNLYQSITPSKTGSKMIFLCAGHYSQWDVSSAAHGPQAVISIYKQIGSGTDTEVHQVSYDYIGQTADGVYHSHHFAATYFDPTATLNTTDDIKYTIYAKVLYASHGVSFNPSSYTGLIIQEYDA